jgi:ankyrin repeat protein
LANQNVPLVPEYHRARVTVVAVSALTFLWASGISIKGRLPLLNIELEDGGTLPYIFSFVLLYGFVRLLIEWFQSERAARQRVTSRIDFGVTLVVAGLAAVLLSYRIIPVWPPLGSIALAGFLLIVGLVTGQILDNVIWGLFFVRSESAALRLGLPRVPAAAQAQIITAVVDLVVFSLIAWLVRYIDSPVARLWPWFMVTPVLLVAPSSLIGFAIRGRKVTREYLDRLRPAFDRHDAMYQGLAVAETQPTALFRAAQDGNVEAVRLLLADGVTPDEPNVHGWTALMIAVANRHSAAARVLMQAGANPNVVNTMGRTALMFAARYGDEPLVSALIEHGAQPNLNESIDAHAIGAAAMSGHAGVVEILLAAGADPSLRDRDGHNAVDYAEMHGFGDMARILRRFR